MEKNKLLLRTNLLKNIRSFSTKKEELYNLLKILQERSTAAGDIEIANVEKIGEAEEKNEEIKKELRERCELKVTLKGIEGQELFGSIDEIFNSPNFPEEISTIFVASDTLLRVVNYYPRNSFKLFLDFTKPAMLNFSFLPSQATPNNSNITVEGYDTTWVHGVFNEINSFIDKHPSKLTWIHQHSVYDLLVWLLGLPLGFWSVYKLSGWLNKIFGSFSVFVKSAAYVYIFLLTLILFRILFHYARWIWPLIEYQSPRNKALKHRIVLGVIFIGLIGKLIYDLIRLII